MSDMREEIGKLLIDKKYEKGVYKLFWESPGFCGHTVVRMLIKTYWEKIKKELNVKEDYDEFFKKKYEENKKEIEEIKETVTLPGEPNNQTKVLLWLLNGLRKYDWIKSADPNSGEENYFSGDNVFEKCVRTNGWLESTGIFILLSLFGFNSKYVSTNIPATITSSGDELIEERKKLINKLINGKDYVVILSIGGYHWLVLGRITEKGLISYDPNPKNEYSHEKGEFYFATFEPEKSQIKKLKEILTHASNDEDTEDIITKYGMSFWKPFIKLYHIGLLMGRGYMPEGLIDNVENIKIIYYTDKLLKEINDNCSQKFIKKEIKKMRKVTKSYINYLKNTDINRPDFSPNEILTPFLTDFFGDSSVLLFGELSSLKNGMKQSMFKIIQEISVEKIDNLDIILFDEMQKKRKPFSYLEDLRKSLKEEDMVLGDEQINNLLKEINELEAEYEKKEEHDATNNFSQAVRLIKSTSVEGKGVRVGILSKDKIDYFKKAIKPDEENFKPKKEKYINNIKEVLEHFRKAFNNIEEEETFSSFLQAYILMEKKITKDSKNFYPNKIKEKITKINEKIVKKYLELSPLSKDIKVPEIKLKKMSKKLKKIINFPPKDKSWNKSINDFKKFIKINEKNEEEFTPPEYYIIKINYFLNNIKLVFKTNPQRTNTFSTALKLYDIIKKKIKNNISYYTDNGFDENIFNEIEKIAKSVDKTWKDRLDDEAKEILRKMEKTPTHELKVFLNLTAQILGSTEATVLELIKQPEFIPEYTESIKTNEEKLKPENNFIERVKELIAHLNQEFSKINDPDIFETYMKILIPIERKIRNNTDFYGDELLEKVNETDKLVEKILFNARKLIKFIQNRSKNQEYKEVLKEREEYLKDFNLDFEKERLWLETFLRHQKPKFDIDAWLEEKKKKPKNRKPVWEFKTYTPIDEAKQEILITKNINKIVENISLNEKNFSFFDKNFWEKKLSLLDEKTISLNSEFYNKNINGIEFASFELDYDILKKISGKNHILIKDNNRNIFVKSGELDKFYPDGEVLLIKNPEIKEFITKKENDMNYIYFSDEECESNIGISGTIAIINGSITELNKEELDKIGGLYLINYKYLLKNTIETFKELVKTIKIKIRGKEEKFKSFMNYAEKNLKTNTKNMNNFAINLINTSSLINLSSNQEVYNLNNDLENIDNIIFNSENPASRIEKIKEKLNRIKNLIFELYEFLKPDSLEYEDDIEKIEEEINSLTKKFRTKKLLSKIKSLFRKKKKEEIIKNKDLEDEDDSWIDNYWEYDYYPDDDEAYYKELELGEIKDEGGVLSEIKDLFDRLNIKYGRDDNPYKAKLEKKSIDNDLKILIRIILESTLGITNIVIDLLDNWVKKEENKKINILKDKKNRYNLVLSRSQKGNFKTFTKEELGKKINYFASTLSDLKDDDKMIKAFKYVFHRKDFNREIKVSNIDFFADQSLIIEPFINWVTYMLYHTSHGTKKIRILGITSKRRIEKGVKEKLKDTLKKIEE